MINTSRDNSSSKLNKREFIQTVGLGALSLASLSLLSSCKKKEPSFEGFNYVHQMCQNARTKVVEFPDKYSPVTEELARALQVIRGSTLYQSSAESPISSTQHRLIIDDMRSRWATLKKLPELKVPDQDYSSTVWNDWILNTLPKALAKFGILSIPEPDRIFLEALRTEAELKIVRAKICPSFYQLAPPTDKSRITVRNTTFERAVMELKGAFTFPNVYRSFVNQNSMTQFDSGGGAYYGQVVINSDRLGAQEVKGWEEDLARNKADFETFIRDPKVAESRIVNEPDADKRKFFLLTCSCIAALGFSQNIALSADKLREFAIKYEADINAHDAHTGRSSKMLVFPANARGITQDEMENTHRLTLCNMATSAMTAKLCASDFGSFGIAHCTAILSEYYFNTVVKKTPDSHQIALSKIFAIAIPIISSNPEKFGFKIDSTSLLTREEQIIVNLYLLPKAKKEYLIELESQILRKLLPMAYK